MRDEGDRRIAEQSVLLMNLPSDVVEFLLARSTVRVFRSGASLFLRGQKANNIFVVLEGWVKLSRISSNGAEAIVGTFTRGCSFGEAVAFLNDDYPVAAEAVTDCRVMCIPAHTVLDVMDQRPELGRAMLASLFKHLHELVVEVEQLKAKTGAQRVAEFLLDLCDSENGACTVTLPYKKTLIAGRLGMKPESLSRAFGRLKECGVTVDHNHARIDNVALLQDYIEKDRTDVRERGS